MEADRRTRLAPDERRTQLLALGVAYLAEHPLDSLTIEYLANEAGVSRALLSHYFQSRKGLHREVVRVARDGLLRASEPVPGLPPLDRLHDTLSRIVQFVRDHRGTFYSLVRGVASGDPEVRDVVEQARTQQADRLIAVFLELGSPDTPMLRIALRSWVSFAEEALVESALGTEMPSAQIVEFLERSAQAVAASVTS